MSTKTSWIITLLLIGVGIAGRLLPHIPNVTPITALALFSATYLRFRYSAVVFLLSMFCADLIIGFYNWHIMAAVYGSFFIAGLIGVSLRKKLSLMRVVGATLSASLMFFLITNWAVWMYGALYLHTLSGLLESYVMGIPFFKNSLMGDLFYTGMFFGVFEYVRNRVPSWGREIHHLT